MENIKKNKILVILGLMAFLANGDNYATASMMSNIASDLGLSVSSAALSVTSYMLAFGAFTLIFGPLSDRYGKAKIINIAAIGTSIFSILGSTAFDLPSLMIFRAINGVFGAGILPVTLALIGDIFNDMNRQKAIGKVMGFAFLGAATATAIGGAISYFGTWRLVYLIYGLSELVLSLLMLRILERDTPVTNKFSFFSSYKEALNNVSFMRIVILLFFIGFSVLGSFTFAGILIQQATGYSVLIAGSILSIFGIGTVIGGKIAPPLRKRMPYRFLIFSGIFGFISLFTLYSQEHIFLMSLGLLGFGIAFIFLQSTLVTTAQEKLPKMKGTAMSLAGFNMFIGGGLGTVINGQIIKSGNIESIFINSAFLMLIVGILAAILVSRFNTEKKLGDFI